jgi:ferredoxin
MTTKFEFFLNSLDEKAWYSAIDNLLPDIHEVDRTATQIWFRFYPLSLFRYLEAAEDKAAALHGFAMQGNYELKNQIDSSHYFLYGHRFWKETKDEIVKHAESFKGQNPKLADEVRTIAKNVSQKAGVDANLTVGIVLAGLMTLVQSGLEAFKQAAGKVSVFDKKSPRDILAERAKDDSQGLLGFLKTVNKEYSIFFNSLTNSGKFKAFQQQEITSAAMNCEVQTDERCIEGPIPVECKSASCGTCWVGILGGADKISAVAPREAKAMKIFGYNQPEGSHPFLRLSCQSKISGNVTLVIPTWNAVFGKKVYDNVEDVELEPATTSAQKLRETIADAVSNNQ